MRRPSDEQPYGDVNQTEQAEARLLNRAWTERAA
jgi:hypothetical protein